MHIIGNIVFPDKPSQEYLVQLVRAQYQIYREEKEAREPKFVPENIRFEHDPYWRYRFMSLQSAHDCDHIGWQIVRVMYAIASATAAPYILGLM